MTKSSLRSYHQYCGIAKALDVIGERWTLLILRDLLLGPRRFSDFQVGLPGLAPNLLTERLKALTAEGVIERQVQPPPAGGHAYALTAVGRELEPALLALGRFGWRYMQAPSRGDVLNLGWALISLKRRFRGSAVPHLLPLTVELRTPERVYQYRLTPDYPDVREGTPWIADLTVTGTMERFRDLFFEVKTGAQLVASKALTLGGDTSRWPALLAAFGFKAPAT